MNKNPNQLKGYLFDAVCLPVPPPAPVSPCSPPHLGGGDIKAYLVVKPNLSQKSGLFLIIRFDIYLTVLRY